MLVCGFREKGNGVEVMTQRSEKFVTRRLVIRVIATFVVVVAVTTAISTSARAPRASASSPTRTGWTEIATVTRTTPLRATSGGPIVGAFDVTWHGQRIFTPVLARRQGWIEVRLPGRPNGSVGWIKATSASLEQTPYAIVVNLATRHLELYEAGRVVLDAPAGIGTSIDPTPTGHFFLGFFARSPGPAWGPFVMVTTAHSNRITDWEDSGDALVAIHGPLGDDREIGTTGATVSHGCIRLHVNDLERLRLVPDGSPITIVAGTSAR
jgi:hypothetical protein